MTKYAFTGAQIRKAENVPNGEALAETMRTVVRAERSINHLVASMRGDIGSLEMAVATGSMREYNLTERASELYRAQVERSAAMNMLFLLGWRPEAEQVTPDDIAYAERHANDDPAGRPMTVTPGPASQTHPEHGSGARERGIESDYTGGIR